MRKSLPTVGADWPTLRAELEALREEDVDWRRGRTAVYVFHAEEDVLEVGKEAYAMYQSENALGAGTAFPSLARMEGDVVAMGLSLLNAPGGACGNMTSGGSESIFLVVKTARDEARAAGMDTRGAEIVMPYSGHPAFDKAAEYLDLRTVRVPVRADFRADVDRMASAITGRTLMLVGSAPCFPFGLIDPIEELSELAVKRGIWLHVDACVGGYFAPFARMNGVDVPAFDFSLQGVRSMSADLHKYGYAPKGASTVFHRTEAQREHQYFNCDRWPLGLMRTPSAAGTRAGGAIAAAWAVMRYLGVEGYRRKARMVIEARERLEAALASSNGLYVLGDPQLGLIAYASRSLDVIALWEEMKAAGWFSPTLEKPPAIHLMLSPEHAKVMDDYVEDLRVATERVSASGRIAATAGGGYT